MVGGRILILCLRAAEISTQSDPLLLNLFELITSSTDGTLSEVECELPRPMNEPLSLLLYPHLGIKTLYLFVCVHWPGPVVLVIVVSVSQHLSAGRLSHS